MGLSERLVGKHSPGGTGPQPVEITGRLAHFTGLCIEAEEETGLASKAQTEPGYLAPVSGHATTLPCGLCFPICWMLGG